MDRKADKEEISKIEENFKEYIKDIKRILELYPDP